MVDAPFDENSKERFVVAELLGSGWAAVQYWWNDRDLKDIGVAGFWEPWDTGPGRYRTMEEADAEARDWAKAEEIRYRPQTPPKTV